jgi:hypothetical protein
MKVWLELFCILFLDLVSFSYTKDKRGVQWQRFPTFWPNGSVGGLPIA